MISWIWKASKQVLFVFLVLMASQWIRWEDRTLSDHVGTWLRRTHLKERIGTLLKDGKSWASRWIDSDPEVGSSEPVLKDSIQAKQAHGERLTSSEQQRLKKLIQDLNQ